MSFGQHIVRLRKQKNWKQGDLATKLGVTQRQLLRWEKDEARPRPQAIEDLAKLFGISVDELISDAHLQKVHSLGDEELMELLNYIPEFEQSRLETLKNILRDMVACQQINRLTSRGARAS